MGWFLFIKIIFKRNIYLQQKCFYKLFYVFDTDSDFKRLQQKTFYCNRMKKSTRTPKTLMKYIEFNWYFKDIKKSSGSKFSISKESYAQLQLFPVSIGLKWVNEQKNNLARKTLLIFFCGSVHDTKTAKVVSFHKRP